MAQRLRVLVYADHHFDEHKRFDECIRVHEWCVDLARRENVGLALSGGDLYERASTPGERQAASEHLTAMAEVAPVGMAKGNHDRPRDVALLGRLRTKHPVLVEEAAGVHLIGGAAVALVAWPDRASIAASLKRRGRAVAPEELEQGVRAFQDAIFVHLADELAAAAGADVPRIVCGHFMIDGAITSVGQPLLGIPMNVGLTELAGLGAPLVIAGHIHKAQEWTHEGCRIVYPGSPFRTDFGQREQKCVVLATFEDARLVDVEFIPTPATPMAHVEAHFADASGDKPAELMVFNEPGELENCRGAEVRLRYRVEARNRDAARAAAHALRDRLVTDGAVVKVEEVVIPTTRARAPEIASAPTLADKLTALWTMRGETLGAHHERALAKVEKLEEETHAA